VRKLLSAVPRIHLAITTHTTRHLRRTLLGVAHQGRRPDSVTISCDNDLPEITELVKACSGEFGAGLPDGIALVQRASIGQCALAQVRNNAVRAILDAGAGPGDAIIFHDGDCCPASDCTAVHERLLAGAELVNAYRVDLTEAQTEAFDEDAVRRGLPPRCHHGRSAGDAGGTRPSLPASAAAQAARASRARQGAQAQDPGRELLVPALGVHRGQRIRRGVPGLRLGRRRLLEADLRCGLQARGRRRQRGRVSPVAPDPQARGLARLAGRAPL
jgi:hypothetical protein